MEIAIFHNFMDNIGGAEMVGLTLARELRADFYSTNIDDEGGHKETVTDGVTGRLIDDINPDKLVQIVKEIGKESGRYKDACLKQAAKFDTKVFVAKIKEQILK